MKPCEIAKKCRCYDVILFFPSANFAESGFDQCNVSHWTDIIAIAAGFRFTAGLKSDGTIVVAEKNNIHHDIILCENIISISAGVQIVGVQSDGRVVASYNPIYNQNDITLWTDIAAVSAGFNHLVGLKYDGTVIALGNNKMGQCDVSQFNNIKVNIKREKNKDKFIENDKNAVECSIKKNIINYEQIKQNRIHTIAAGGDHTLGIRYNGSVIATGDKYYGQCYVSGWEKIISVSAGSSHSVGLKSNGTVVAVGDEGVIRDYRCDVNNWKKIIAISAGGYHTVGLKDDGTVIATGDNEKGQCNVLDWKNIVAVSAGEDHTLGLKADGTVIATGDNKNCQCNVSDWTDIVAVAAGAFCSVGLKSNGTVIATGKENSTVSLWKNIVAISADLHIVGLQNNGKVLAVGENKHNQCDVSMWDNIVAIAAGEGHTVGLKSNGTVVAVGYNGESQCNVYSWKNINIILNTKLNHTLQKSIEETMENAVVCDKLFILQEFANKEENVVPFFDDTSPNLKKNITQSYETLLRIDEYAQKIGLKKDKFFETVTIRIRPDASEKAILKNTIVYKDLYTKCFIVDGKKYDNIEQVYIAAEKWDILFFTFNSVNKNNINSIHNVINTIQNMQYDGESKKTFLNKLSEFEKKLRTVNGILLASYEEAEKARIQVKNSKKYVKDRYGDIDFYSFTDTGNNRVKNVLADIHKIYGKFADLQLIDECKKYIDECERISKINLQITYKAIFILAILSLILMFVIRDFKINDINHSLTTVFSIGYFIILIQIYRCVKDILKKKAYTTEIKILTKIRFNKICPFKQYYIQIASIILIAVFWIVISLLGLIIINPN